MRQLVLVGMLLALPAGAAETPPPAAALKAEMAGQWDEAAAVYQQLLSAAPERLDLWLRLADVRAQQKQYAEAAKALSEASRLQPQEAELWMKLSRAQSMAGDGPGAFASAGRALALAPDHVDYLRARGELAVWVDDKAAAIEVYQRLAQLQPGEPAVLLGLARQLAWGGQTDKAVVRYRAYLAQRAEDKAVWLELAKTEGWRGNYAEALDVLATYRERFGEDQSYWEQHARALAWLGKSRLALGEVAPLLAAAPKDVDLLTTRAIALQAGNRPREALATLEEIRTLKPTAKETADLSRYLKTPQRSSVTLAVNYGKDSDQVGIGRLSLEGEYVLNPETRFQLGGEGQRLTADVGSGLENRNGSSDARYQSAWLGAQHRFSPQWAADLRVGGGHVSSEGGFPLYRAGLEWRPNDEWWFRPEVEQDLYAVSPRAASLQVRREAVRLAGRWTPGTRYTVDATLAKERFSDDNERWEATLAPRRAFWRTQDLNVDLGLSGRWFGFRKDLANGYYDPLHYQRYALTGFFYWKVNDNNGISLALSAGMHKDHNMPTFKFGSDAVLQGFFGIYSDWYLRVYGSLLSNTRSGSGSYRGMAVGAALTRRF